MLAMTTVSGTSWVSRANSNMPRTGSLCTEQATVTHSIRPADRLAIASTTGARSSLAEPAQTMTRWRGNTNCEVSRATRR